MRKQSQWMKMDLYKKVENVIQDHIKEHKAEVRKGKELMSKLDVVRCNAVVKADGYSVHYYDYDRNDPNRANPFIETPDYTEL